MNIIIGGLSRLRYTWLGCDKDACVFIISKIGLWLWHQLKRVVDHNSLIFSISSEVCAQPGREWNRLDQLITWLGSSFIFELFNETRFDCSDATVDCTSTRRAGQSWSTTMTRSTWLTLMSRYTTLALGSTCSRRSRRSNWALKGISDRIKHMFKCFSSSSRSHLHTNTLIGNYQITIQTP